MNPAITPMDYSFSAPTFAVLPTRPAASVAPADTQPINLIAIKSNYPGIGTILIVLLFVSVITIIVMFAYPTASISKSDQDPKVSVPTNTGT